MSTASTDWPSCSASQLHTRTHAHRRLRAAEVPGAPAAAGRSAADRRKGGPWAPGYRARLQALKRARLVSGLNGADRGGVLPHLPDPSRLVALSPFIDRTPFEKAADNREACRRSLATRY